MYVWFEQTSRSYVRLAGTSDRRLMLWYSLVLNYEAPEAFVTCYCLARKPLYDMSACAERGGCLIRSYRYRFLLLRRLK